MKREKSRVILKLGLLLSLLGQGLSDSERDFRMCGKWNHGTSRNIWFDLRVGCENLTIAANESTLSIEGNIMGQCQNSSTIPLPDSSKESQFCVFWDPLLDLLQVEMDGRNHTLCQTEVLQESCCTYLSLKSNENASEIYGIKNGETKGDVIKRNLQRMYSFYGEKDNCKKDFCKEAVESHGAKSIEQLALRSGIMGRMVLPCAEVSTTELKEGFEGLVINLTPLPGFIGGSVIELAWVKEMDKLKGRAIARNYQSMEAPQSKALEQMPSVALPPSLMPHGKTSVKMVLTYYSEKTLFQQSGDVKAEILNEVVGISIENEVISNLPDPVKITFSHRAMPTNKSTKCVFWDTKQDPNEVMWRWEGCQTIRRQGETECRCNHLTYFAILVDLKLGSEVDHLEALTYITSVGCAVSLCSCFCLIILLTKMLRRKAQVQLSIPIHRNLAVALFLLCTLFVLTGVVANIGSEEVCRVVGAALHYSLLCSFTWMGIEIFAAFWLVHRVMSPFPDHRLFSLLGFVLPAVLVAVLVSINDIYGTREIIPSGDVTNPYKMCWLKDNPSGSLVHYITNISYSAGVVFAGLVMLCLVLNKIQTRPEWSRNQASFLSIWGLSCLFGCTWSLEFLNFGSLSESVLFLFCAINSLQGFFLMLRFVLLEWMKKQGSVMERSSTGSTKQPMLLEPEKS